jgi:hypothetical protein
MRDEPAAMVAALAGLALPTGLAQVLTPISIALIEEDRMQDFSVAERATATLAGVRP